MPLPDKERNAMIVRLVTELGETEGWVANAYGITRQRVSQIIRRAGHDVGRGRHPEQATRELMRAYSDKLEEGLSPAEAVSQLAEALGEARVELRTTLKRNGIDTPRQQDKVWPHGSVQRYRLRRYRCRCDACRDANAAYSLAGKLRMLERRKGQPVPERVHGTSAGYQYWGCRCARCTQGHSEYTRPYARAYALRQKEKRERGA